MLQILNRVKRPESRLLWMLLLTLIISTRSYSQGKPATLDSTTLQKELDSILAKHGLKSKGFNITVISVNQAGGQTAYSITNNWYGIRQRVLTIEKLKEIVSHIPAKSTKILLFASHDKESENYVSSIYSNLKSNGYTNVSFTWWGDPNCFDQITYEMKQDTTLDIFVCPASNVSQ